MELEVTSESSFDFSISYDDTRYHLRCDGGEWILRPIESGKNGPTRVWMGDRRTKWHTALNRALIEIERAHKQ